MRVAAALLWVLLITAARGSGDEPRAAATGDRADDEKAIRAADEAFVRAYNAGDARAVADLFDEDAEAVSKDGETVRGREAIAGLFASIFEAAPGRKIEVAVDSLRFLGAVVALETGRTTLSAADGRAPEVDRFTVLFVKKDGRWLQARVQEHAKTQDSPHDRLKELEWMVGEWVDEGSNGVVFTTCRWSDDANYLLREYTIRVGGRPAMSGTQRIGWDPQAGQIRSWIFDSDGSFGEALWSRDGNRWIVKATFVLRDGRRASATQVITFVTKDMARWKQVDRTVGGEAVPDIDEVVVVKRPPQPR
jgi:uncharacterized protein (TIGR02246 family)